MTPEVVTAASNAWVWVPENATTVETPEYLLVRFPGWFEHPAAIQRFGPTRDTATVLDEVLAHARDFGVDRVVAWAKMGAHDDLPRLLEERGGVADEVLDVLALDLTPGAPAIDPPLDDLTLTWATERDTLRDSEVVSVEVFGSSMPPDEELDAMTERFRRSHPTGESCIVVAYRDGRPVGFGGLAVVDGVARLWGGAVLEEARGRGVYRALLAARIDQGLAHGATMALVKGRVETSGPILRRAGFAPYGQECSFLVPL